MADVKKIKTALVSVFHKDGLDELLAELNKNGVKFLSTGGTQAFIESLGYPCQKVEDLTTYPSIAILRTKAEKFVVPNCCIFCWIACNSSGVMRMIFTILRSAIGITAPPPFYSPKFSANFLLAGFAASPGRRACVLSPVSDSILDGRC